MKRLMGKIGHTADVRKVVFLIKVGVQGRWWLCCPDLAGARS